MGEPEWGPWHELDGRGPPHIPKGAVFEVIFSGSGVRIPDHSVVEPETWPGFFWRWKTIRISWFEKARRRVCDVPDYAPIIRVRIQKPPAQKASLLAEIVANPPAALIKGATDKDRRLPKRVPA